MKFSTFSAVAVSMALILTGCASVDMASQSDSAKAKEFAPPSQGNAGLMFSVLLVGAEIKTHRRPRCLNLCRLGNRSVYTY